MSIHFHVEKIPNASVINGYFDGQTGSPISGFIRQVIVKAISANTMFDFAIQDEDGIEIYSRETITHEINELTEIPATNKVLNLKIRNSTNNENFLIYLAIQEL